MATRWSVSRDFSGLQPDIAIVITSIFWQRLGYERVRMSSYCRVIVEN